MENTFDVLIITLVKLNNMNNHLFDNNNYLISTYFAVRNIKEEQCSQDKKINDLLT